VQSTYQLKQDELSQNIKTFNKLKEELLQSKTLNKQFECEIHELKKNKDTFSLDKFEEKINKLFKAIGQKNR